MAIGAADQQKLDTLYAEYGAKYKGRKEDYFALQYIVRKFKVEPSDVGHQIAFGGNDYGLDAYYIDRTARNLYLFQFKWTDNHNQFKGSMERLAADGLARIFGAQSQDPNQNDLVSYLKKDLREAREIIQRVYVHFVFKGDVDAAEKSEGLQARREDIEGKAYLANTYLGHEVELQVDFIADKPGQKGPPAPQSYKLMMDSLGAAKHDGKTMHVGFVPLMDLYRIYRALGQEFFERNIRSALSPDNPPNRKIREALDRIVLKKVDDPSIFVFRHNGVTLAADGFKPTGGHEVILHMPRLLNGAQTLSSLRRFLDDQKDNAALAANRDRLDEIRVLARVVVDNPTGDFVTQVTISNNQQNPVPPWALRAMDQRQVDFADKFREELGIFYSRQEGSFELLSDDEREELGIAESRDLRIRPLAQTLLAVQGDVYNMGRLPEVFESQKLYETAFKQSFQYANPRQIVLGYKVGLMIGRGTARLREDFAAKYQVAIPRARNILWALLIQALLNDKHIADYLEDYGTTLTKEASFGEVIRQLTGSKVGPLLRALFQSSTYREKADQEKFDFLRTSEAFKKAMMIGADRYKWVKKSFQ